MMSILTTINNNLAGAGDPEDSSVPFFSPHVLDKFDVKEILKGNEATSFIIRVMTEDEYNGEGKLRPCIFVQPVVGGVAAVALNPNLRIIKSWTFEETKVEGVLTLPETLTRLGTAAFRGCSGIRRLILPNSLTSISERAFKDCSGIEGPLTLPETLTEIGFAAFMGCSGIKGRLILPKGLTKIGFAAFEGCSNLTEVMMNRKTRIEKRAFAGTGITNGDAQRVVKLVEKIDYDDSKEYTIGN